MARKPKKGPKGPSAAETQADHDRRCLRAKQFCLDNRLARLEVESPGGRLVLYKSPVEYLEAFAFEEIQLARRGGSRAATVSMDPGDTQDSRSYDDEGDD